MKVRQQQRERVGRTTSELLVQFESLTDVGLSRCAAGSALNNVTNATVLRNVFFIIIIFGFYCLW